MKFIDIGPLVIGAGEGQEIYINVDLVSAFGVNNDDGIFYVFIAGELAENAMALKGTAEEFLEYIKL